MATSDPSRLRQIHGTALAILEQLWIDGFHGNKRGLTATELAESLHVTPVTINETVRGLKNRTRPLVTEASGVSDDSENTGIRRRRGKLPVVYSLNEELIITWPSSAASVLQLYAYPNRTANSERLVQDLLAKDWTDSFRGQPETNESILKQLKFAESRNYIGRVPEHSDLLCVGPSAKEEHMYLEFLKSKMTATRPLNS